MNHVKRARRQTVAGLAIVLALVEGVAGLASGAPAQQAAENPLSVIEQRLSALESRVTQLEAENASLRTRVETLEHQLESERAARGAENASILAQAKGYTDYQIRAAIAPDPPADLTVTNVGYSTVTLAWRSSSGATSYRIYRGDTLADTVKENRYIDTGRGQGQKYTYRVSAVDANGIESLPSNSVSATLLSDPTAPTMPTNLKAQSVGMSRVRLTWTASRDNVSVVGYKVLAYASGAGVIDYGVVRGTSYEARGLNHRTHYEFSVMAVDPADNKSRPATVDATTENYTITRQTYSSSSSYQKTYINLVGQSVAQTFVYPEAGSIWAAQVDLQISSPATFTAQIQAVDINGKPTGRVLAQRVLRVESSGLTEFAFIEPANVAGETQCAFVLSSDAQQFQVGCTTPDSYDDGLAYVRADQWKLLIHLGVSADLRVIIYGIGRYD